MKILKSHVGKIIRVEFYDHCLGSGDPIKCIAVGQLTKVTKIGITLRYWEADPTFGSHNDEVMSILRSAILKFKILS